MTCLLRWLACFFTVALLASPPVRADDTVWGGVVTGKVVGPDGKPVAGASVCLVVNTLDPRDLPDFQTRTQPNGAFAFRPLDDRQFPPLVFAVKPGYGVAVLPLETVVKRTGLVLRLRPGAPVEARVVNSTGEPVSGATVRLLQGGWSKGVSIAFFDCLKTKTDATGSVRIPWLGEQDTAAISIEHPLYGKHEENLVAGAGPLSVRLAPAGRLTGRVVHAGTNAPEKFATVHCQPLREWEEGSDTGERSTFPDARGEYVIENLAPGDYVVWVRDIATSPTWVASRQRVSGLRDGAALRCPDLVLQEGALLTGKVEDEKTGVPIPSPQVSAVMAAVEPWNRKFTATSSGDGTFWLRVPPGAWAVELGAVPGYAPGVGLPARPLKNGEKLSGLVLRLTRLPTPATP